MKQGIPDFGLLLFYFQSIYLFSFEKELRQDITYFRHLSGSIWLEPSPGELEDTVVIVCEKIMVTSPAKGGVACTLLILNS